MKKYKKPHSRSNIMRSLLVTTMILFELIGMPTLIAIVTVGTVKVDGVIVTIGATDSGLSNENGDETSGEMKIATSLIEQDKLSERETKAVAEKMAVAVQRNLAEYIDLQGVVENWAAKTPGQVAVEVYDLNYGRVAASYQADAVMSPKSLYKLFYAYDGHTQISMGTEDPNQPYLGESTLGYCLDVMIRNSDNPCAEAMLDDPARSRRVGEMVANLGLGRTSSNGLSTSAHDVSLLMQRYVAHPEWSGDVWTKFLDSALRQPASMRRGLPSGFQKATIYNKTGFGPNSGGYVYNDAAIVEFAGGRRYIVVVMTEGATVASLANLGSALEKAMLYDD